jgi:hypothetical protein
MVEPPPLRRMHGDAIYEEGSAKDSLEYHRRRTTDEIVASLWPNQEFALRVTRDGLIKNGNTRIKVLMERGYDVNTLPREIVP